MEIGVAHFVPALEPGDELFRLLCPEAFRVLDGALVHGLVGGFVEPGLARELSGHGINLLGHGLPPPSGALSRFVVIPAVVPPRRAAGNRWGATAAAQVQ